MGAMSPSDWTILETLPEYDALLKQTIAGKGDAWFRYNYDGYGEYNDGRNYDGSGRGRLWPIFTAERGIYEIAKAGAGAKGEPIAAWRIAIVDIQKIRRIGNNLYMIRAVSICWRIYGEAAPMALATAFMEFGMKNYSCTVQCIRLHHISLWLCGTQPPLLPNCHHDA